MADTKSTDFKSFFKTLEGKLDELNKQAPQLPGNWKEFIVKIAPYLAIIGVIFGIPAVLTLLGFGAFFVPMGTIYGVASGRPFLGAGYLISVFFLIAVMILEALSISPLFKRSKTGWNYMYYATLLGAVQNLISFNLTGLVIGTLIGLYLLFQVRGLYK